MTIEIEKSFKQKVCEEVQLEAEGVNRFIVYTPFLFDDGDHFVVILKQEGTFWVLTDEGHTFMHMSYEGVDYTKGTRQKIIDEAIQIFHLQNRGGELVLPIENGAFGDALFTFVQALTRISSTTLWTKEIISTTFFEDLDTIIVNSVAPIAIVREYSDPEIDPHKNYVVPYKINAPSRPCFLFGVGSDLDCTEAIITCGHYERHRIQFDSIAVFEDQTVINRRAVAQLSDIIGKSIASLGAKDRLKSYLELTMGRK